MQFQADDDVDFL